MASATGIPAVSAAENSSSDCTTGVPATEGVDETVAAIQVADDHNSMAIGNAETKSESVEDYSNPTRSMPGPERSCTRQHERIENNNSTIVVVINIISGSNNNDANIGKRCIGRKNCRSVHEKHTELRSGWTEQKKEGVEGL